jgi:chaperonin GroEL (HSP60 family)
LKDANMVCYVANVLHALSHVLQFATEAAITILRIDDMIRIEKAEDDGMEG